MANINKIKLSGTTYNIQDLNASKTVELTQAQYDALAVKDPNTFYIITDAQGADLSQYYTSAQTESAITQAVSGKADTSAVTESINAAVSGKVDTSTFNTYSGSVETALSGKQDTLSAGTNITIVDNVISAEGGGGKAVSGGTNISVTTGETADTINCTVPITGNGNSIFAGYAIDNVYSNNNIVISTKTSSNINLSKIYAKDSISIGQNTILSGNSTSELSTAIGHSSKVYGVQSTALGVGCNANGNMTLAIGRYSTSNGNDSIAIGNQANVSGNSSVAIGRLAKVSGDSSVAIGSGATANGVDYKMNLNNQIKVTPSNQVYIYNKDNTEMICLQDQLGGGGATYSAGTGIDITNDVISVSGVVMSSAVTSAVTSASTDSEVPSAKAVYDAIQEGGGSITVDTALNSGSTNPVENRVIYNKIDEVEQVTARALNELNETLSGKADSNSVYTKTEANVLLDEKLDVTAYTPTDLSNYYTKSETSGASEIQNALNDMVDYDTYSEFELTFNSYTASTQTALDDKVDNPTYSAYTASTQTALNGKLDTSSFNTYTAATNSRLSEDEEVTARALNDLNDRIIQTEATIGDINTILNSI